MSNLHSAPAPLSIDGEVIIVNNDTDEVVCNGGSIALGHPQVWYSFDNQDNVTCGYCDRVFVKERAKTRFPSQT
ncbi:MAG: zinc-finger domain-containing protein [Alphaproteobacteria bacterium]|nr:zinc-finger domain-containing protein [Alphaproteobacteria bacterium]